MSYVPCCQGNANQNHFRPRSTAPFYKTDNNDCWQACNKLEPSHIMLEM